MLSTKWWPFCLGLNVLTLFHHNSNLMEIFFINSNPAHDTATNFCTWHYGITWHFADNVFKYIFLVKTIGFWWKYSAMSLLCSQFSHNRCLICCPWRRDIRCLLWVQSLIYVLLVGLQYCDSWHHARCYDDMRLYRWNLLLSVPLTLIQHYSVQENFQGHAGRTTCKNIQIAGPASQLHVTTVGTNVILTNYSQSSRTCKCFICQSILSIASLGLRTCKFHRDWH